MLSAFIIVNSVILGIIASLSPCLFPVLPTFIAYLTNSDSNRLNGLVAAGLVTTGIMTVFMFLGLIYNSVFAILSPNYLKFRAAQGIILIFLGVLLIAGVSFKWNWLNKMNAAADSLIQKVDNPWITSYLIGLTFTILAAPCAIIVFGTAFALAANTSLLGTLTVMILFSLGAGLPFFIVGGFLPSAKEILMENRRNIEAIVTALAGLIVIGVGSFMTLEGFRVI